MGGASKFRNSKRIKQIKGTKIINNEVRETDKAIRIIRSLGLKTDTKSRIVEVDSRDVRATYKIPINEPIKIPVQSSSGPSLKGGTSVELLGLFGAKIATQETDRNDNFTPGILPSAGLGVTIYEAQEEGTSYKVEKEERNQTFYFSSGPDS